LALNIGFDGFSGFNGFGGFASSAAESLSAGTSTWQARRFSIILRFQQYK
jgi:hypothetical protein